MPSEYLDHERDVLVWLPPGYRNAPARRYPVLYLHDGQNKFDPDTSFAGEDWNVDGVATQLIEDGEIEPFLMVAIYNSPDRLFEYNPLRRQGKRYARFILEELMPTIDQHFRTEGGRRNAVMGSSMGGLISIAILWWHWERFFGAAALSPSLWVLWRAGGPASWLQRFPAPRQPARLYIDHGTVGYEGRGARLTEEILDYLKGVYFPPDALHYHTAEGGEHNEASWRARVDRPLRFLFGKGTYNASLSSQIVTGP
ncbi:MAG: alpha/beta hydrolase-fold protein [Chloroflexota bacterium]|nr:alpha/beta hydrolase-fold protein [Chloroflexota bacterium]